MKSLAAYSPYDLNDDLIVRKGVTAGRCHTEIGEQIGRSPKSVGERIRILRRKGFIVGYEPSRIGGDAPTAGDGPGVPFRLVNDHELVRATRAEGGFPLPVQLNGRTFWINADCQPWQHIRPGGEAPQSGTYICDPDSCSAIHGRYLPPIAGSGQCWHESTARRLEWSGTTSPMAAARDLAAWNALGQPRKVAA